MHRRLAQLACCLALIALPVWSQEPEPEPPPEETETKPTETESPAEEGADPQQEPTEEPVEETTPPPEADQAEDAEAEEPERILTPKEQEIRRKADERAAKQEARRERRATKKEEEEAKRAAKAARQEVKTGERVAELIELGKIAIETQKYEAARGHFNKVKELEGGRSYDAEMGLARIQLELGNYAQAVQLAQKASASTGIWAQKAEALTFAGKITLAARPMVDEDPSQPVPGTEMFVDAALRFFIRAVEAAPTKATEASAYLEERFPSRTDERAARLLAQYLELAPDAEAQHARRLSVAYEALLSGGAAEGSVLAVIGPISSPERLSGPRPRYLAPPDVETRRWLIAGLAVEPDGTVSAVEVINGVNPEQDAAVVEALSQWTFEPARLPDGTAVATYWLRGVSVSPE